MIRSEEESEEGAEEVVMPMRFEKYLGRCLKFYITGHILEASRYADWFETIRSAGENDIIMFHINSYGGDLLTTIQLMHAMEQSSATIVASVEGACMSAATLIFLKADHREIAEHSSFLFHNYSNSVQGKGGELYDTIIHERSWSLDLLKKCYAGFLTDTEITEIIGGKDLWMSGDMVKTRLLKMEAEAKAKAEKTTKPTAKKTTKPTAKKKTEK
jgi:ATP-dependent protease ClpP protease subunit